MVSNRRSPSSLGVNPQRLLLLAIIRRGKDESLQFNLMSFNTARSQATH